MEPALKGSTSLFVFFFFYVNHIKTYYPEKNEAQRKMLPLTKNEEQLVWTIAKSRIRRGQTQRFQSVHCKVYVCL